MQTAAPYLLVLLVTTAVIHSGFAVYAWRKRATGARLFSLVNVSLAIWLGGYAGELIGADLTSKYLWALVEYVGIVTVPVLWFAYAQQMHDSRSRWLAPSRIGLLLVMPLTTLVILATTQWHGLHWKSFELSGPEPLLALRVTYGPWFWVHFAYSYLMLAIGTARFLSHVLRASDLYRGQAIVLVFASLFPWFINLIYLTGMISLPGLDPTPFAFSLSALALGWDIFRYRLLDPMPVARMRVLATMLEAVIVVDPQNRVVEANPAARAVLDPRARVGDGLAQALAHWPELLTFAGEPGEGRAEIALGKDGRMFEARRALLSDGPTRASGRLLVLREITESLQSARDLGRARDEALEASRLKTQLLAKVSHELRTPLGAILGYSEMLQSGAYGHLTERGQAATQRVIHSANYLARLVDDLLDQAQLEAGRIRLNPQAIDLRTQLEPLCAQIGEQARVAGLSFEHSISPDLPALVIVDGARLQQIVHNLLHNALKYTHAGGVRCALTWSQAPEPGLTITIRDTGVGIPAEAQAHIFEPFWQANHALTGRHSGYGLGLAIVAELARLMGGSVSVESEVEQGSQFTVWLPTGLAATDIVVPTEVREDAASH